MFETFAEGFDIKLLEWTEKVELGVEKENVIMANLKKAAPSAVKLFVRTLNMLETTGRVCISHFDSLAIMWMLL